MPLRRRLAFIAAASVAVAILFAALACYLVVRSQLRGQVDTALTAQSDQVRHYGQRGLGSYLPGIPATAGGPAQYFQVVLPTGQLVRRQGGIDLPIDSNVLAVAAGTTGQNLRDLYVGASHLRVLTMPVTISLPDVGLVPGALQLARPLNGVDHVLSSLRLILTVLLVAGIAMAAGLGRFAARRVLAPLNEVAEAAQHISETNDLTRRIRVHADDEVGQLATRFNHMLDRLEGSRQALDESVRAQRQLVADASHELRTPVTSLRTNIEVLLAGGELDPEDRRRLLSDVVEQSEELSSLVGDLIELARGDQPGPETEYTRLDQIASESLARARRNAPGIEFRSHLEPMLIDGVPERLGRAINNLLDNAARHSPPGGAVEVTVDLDGIIVRDHGTGIPEADLPYVFDRFFRGSGSRGRQGSGLGLAIVRQVAEQHGGSVTAANAPDGGAVFTLSLPLSPANEPPSAPVPAQIGRAHG